MSITHEFRRMLWKTGYDISRFNPCSNALARRKKLLESWTVDVVLDVGANTGQFGRQLRDDLGYTGRIVSFEPLRSAFTQLCEQARGDERWQTYHCALGDSDSVREINVAGNSQSSSLLNMLAAHRQAAPESSYVGREVIAVRSLDSMIDEVCLDGDRVYLKIDTQGYESRVIKGGERSLARVETIQLEMSLVPLYDGEMLFGEMHALLSGKGYRLVSIEPGFTDGETGELLQVDGIYHRRPQ